MSMTRILGISGSLGRGSYNTALLRAGAPLLDGRAELQIALLHDIPLYDGDLEAAAGLPQAVRDLKARVIACDGLLLATPECNNGVSGVFKNALIGCRGQCRTSRRCSVTARLGSSALRPAGLPGLGLGIVPRSPGRDGSRQEQPQFFFAATVVHVSASCLTRFWQDDGTQGIGEIRKRGLGLCDRVPVGKNKEYWMLDSILDLGRGQFHRTIQKNEVRTLLIYVWDAT